MTLLLLFSLGSICSLLVGAEVVTDDLIYVKLDGILLRQIINVVEINEGLNQTREVVRLFLFYLLDH